MYHSMAEWLDCTLLIVFCDDCIIKFVVSLQDFGVEDVIQGQFIISHFKPDLIKMILSYLVPSKVR